MSAWDSFTGGFDDLLGLVSKGGSIYNDITKKEEIRTQPVTIADEDSKATTAIAVTFVAVGGLLAIVVAVKLLGK